MKPRARSRARSIAWPTRDGDPPSDGSSQIWTAEQVTVVDIAPPGRTFTLRVPSATWDWFTRIAPDRLRVVDGTDVTCAPPRCDAVEALTSAADLELAYTDGPLELRDVPATR